MLLSISFIFFLSNLSHRLRFVCLSSCRQQRILNPRALIQCESYRAEATDNQLSQIAIEEANECLMENSREIHRECRSVRERVEHKKLYSK